MTNILVLDTVIMGNARLYEIMKEKEAIYAKGGFLLMKMESVPAELEGRVCRDERLGSRI